MAVTIHFPDGKTQQLPDATDESTDKLISKLLEAQQVHLNYRCGGRGICKGCTLTTNDTSESKQFKACQTKLKDLETHDISIPVASLQDRSIQGVTDFTLLATPSNPSDTGIDDNKGVGIAIDVGTTTVAVALWDLQNRKSLGVISEANKQDQFGDNVLARISYSIDHPKGSEKLKTTLLEHTLAPMIQSLFAGAKIPFSSAKKCLVSANTVMLHTFTGDPLDGFGSYPFAPVFTSRTLSKNPFSFLTAIDQIELLPSFGPFVGSDICAGAIAAGIHLKDQEQCNHLLIDFGTNGEILLKANGKTYVTATAAGPAFEGGNLNCGKKAQNGVISSFQAFVEEENKWAFNTIGDFNQEPFGISGAGFIDWIAIAHQVGIINDFGRFDPTDPRLRTETIRNEPTIVFPISKHLYISESDIAELLQAKGAIAAGILTLLDLAGIKFCDINKVYICGGFGYHLNLANATSIGLLPKVSKSASIEVLGNSSLGGTSLHVLHPELKATFDEMAINAQVVELNQEDEFEDNYIDSLMIGEID